MSTSAARRATSAKGSLLRGFFVREDPEFDRVVGDHRAKTAGAKIFYLALHLLPGFLAYVGIFYLREPLMSLGLSGRYAQFSVLISMTMLWQIVFVFLMMRYADKLSFKDSLKFLGLANLDLGGLLTVLPILTAAFVVLSAPYMAWVHPAIYRYLDSFPAIAIRDWHILEIGYYAFPPAVLLVVFVGNFLGEEIYFRGYLLQKISGIPGHWAIGSLLFQLYHVWQAPLNWAFAPFFLFVPLTILVVLRRSLYGAIFFHVFVNLAWGGVLYLLFGVG